mmetsp:Transcript_24070/g.94825  ORF Transcript_24070/g.94825 Transcript_24070/m.94825 type:complete len:108 (-) Transcript_24070:2189-2512(-)|eukprot:CAMPEP_0113972588 /NCGR_PEP_ID=MMETSP0011_2-20120614/13599_1 /TAXON_ID=101924 /ORGANISM="Rhodosorus marinus" /LENGTH=107 /DNA_ID=CAMNT_0000989659 /DNA_START=110 /DNA_END=433 /DNA_ORIENTATION=- /assembly_acc=CAM_ASM_000156
MADENNDLFAKAFGMYEEVRETVLSSEAYRKCVAASSYVSGLTASAAGAAGSAAWVVGTAMVIGILPALFAVDRELNPLPAGDGKFPLMENPPGEAVPSGDSSNASK